MLSVLLLIFTLSIFSILILCFCCSTYQSIQIMFLLFSVLLPYLLVSFHSSLCIHFSLYLYFSFIPLSLILFLSKTFYFGAFTFSIFFAFVGFASDAKTSLDNTISLSPLPFSLSLSLSYSSHPHTSSVCRAFSSICRRRKDAEAIFCPIILFEFHLTDNVLCFAEGE